MKSRAEKDGPRYTLWRCFGCGREVLARAGNYPAGFDYRTGQRCHFLEAIPNGRSRQILDNRRENPD
jgi:hypothetical protein